MSLVHDMVANIFKIIFLTIILLWFWMFSTHMLDLFLTTERLNSVAYLAELNVSKNNRLTEAEISHYNTMFKSIVDQSSSYYEYKIDNVYNGIVDSSNEGSVEPAEPLVKGKQGDMATIVFQYTTVNSILPGVEYRSDAPKGVGYRFVDNKGNDMTVLGDYGTKKKKASTSNKLYRVVTCTRRFRQ